MLACGIVSRVGSGFLADRIGGIRTLLIGSLLQGFALLFYLFFDSLASLYIISAMFGLFQGGLVPAYAIIIREAMPASQAATRVGIVILGTVGGMSLGGWMSGVIFDATGSYAAAFMNGLAWNALNVTIITALMLRGAPQVDFLLGRIGRLRRQILHRRHRRKSIDRHVFERAFGRAATEHAVQRRLGNRRHGPRDQASFVRRQPVLVQRGDAALGDPVQDRVENIAIADLADQRGGGRSRRSLRDAHSATPMKGAQSRMNSPRGSGIRIGDACQSSRWSTPRTPTGCPGQWETVLRDRYRNKFTREATVGRETCRTYYR